MTAAETITDTELSELMDWPALIEHDLLYEIEEDCQNPSHGVNRRILLATLTMDSEKLFEACEEAPDAYFDGFRCSASTLGMYKRLVKLMDIGHHRLMAGLCGVDTDDPDAPFTKKEFFAAMNEAEGKDINDDEIREVEKTDK